MSDKAPYRCMPDRKRHHWRRLRSIKNPDGTHTIRETCKGCFGMRLTVCEPKHWDRQSVTYKPPKNTDHPLNKVT